MKLFISYSRDDKAWVYELWRALRDRAYHDAWIDQRVVPAQDWWDSILTNIEDADCAIYVVTPRSTESIFCLAEIEYALALNKPVVPIMLKPCDMPTEITRRRIQYETVNDHMTLGDILFTIERALSDIRVGLLQGKHLPPDSLPYRPNEPVPTRKPEQVIEVFMMAEEAASEQNSSLAEKLFQRVIDADPTGYGRAATERLSELLFDRRRSQDYLNIMQMSANPALHKGALALWRVFVDNYGVDYDPENMATRLVKITPPPPKKNLKRLAQDLLPTPFDWVSIPSGKVNLEDNKGTFDVAAFDMAKYPITVAQYKLFMQDDGYANSDWWTEAGWTVREKEGWTEPRYWNDGALNGADYPMVGVSWYEAYAFTQWLSTQTGESIHLPTEQQWQWAAQGDDGRTYPWGKNWDASRCNNDVEGRDWRKKKAAGKITTPVTHYEGQGNSPFGVVDMAGNVWEWTLSAYDTAKEDIDSTNNRVLRGGSWIINDTGGFRCAFRGGGNPNFWFISIGFRVARSSS